MWWTANMFLYSVLLAIVASAYPQTTTPGTPSPTLNGKTLRLVTVRQGMPYDLFFDDFIDVLQKEMGFTVTTESLMRYGVKDKDGKWDGMVGRLVNRTADIAISDLTITPARSEVIDFTVPFIKTGVSVLINVRDVGNMTSVEDLANQDEVKVTTIGRSSITHFLSHSNSSALQKIYQKILEASASDPDFLTSNNAQGVERVAGGGVAMFMRQLTFRHLVNNNCDFRQLGGLLDDIGYGIGLQKDSPYTGLFNQAIRKLRDEGKIKELMDKHWVRYTGTSGCPLAS